MYLHNYNTAEHLVVAYNKTVVQVFSDEISM